MQTHVQHRCFIAGTPHPVPVRGPSSASTRVPTCGTSGGTSGLRTLSLPERNSCLHSDGERRGGLGAAAPPRRTESRGAERSRRGPAEGSGSAGLWGRERGCERGRSAAPSPVPPQLHGRDPARCRPARLGSDAAMGSRFSRIPALPRGGQGRLHRARHHHLKGTAPRCAPRWDGHPGRTETLRRVGTQFGMSTQSTTGRCGVGCPTLGAPRAGALRVRPRPGKARGQRVGGDGAPKCPQVSLCE